MADYALFIKGIKDNEQVSFGLIVMFHSSQTKMCFPNGEFIIQHGNITVNTARGLIKQNGNMLGKLSQKVVHHPFSC